MRDDSESQHQQCCSRSTMKSTLAILVALATFIGAERIPEFGKGPLHDDMQDFLNLVPIEKVVAVTKEYTKTDKEFQTFMRITSEEYKEILREIEAIPEVIDFLNYLEAHGIYAYDIVNTINRSMGLPELQPPKAFAFAGYGVTGGLTGYVKDIKAIMPTKEFVALHRTKMQKSSAWVDFINYVNTSGARNIGKKIAEGRRFQILIGKLKVAGVDIDSARDALHEGWRASFVTPDLFSLQDDLDDFVKLLPMDKIAQIMHDYMTNDPEVQRTLEYAQTKEFHDLVYVVEDLKEYQDLVLYLHHAGLDIFKYIQFIHDLFGMDPYVPPVASYNGRIDRFVYATGGFTGMLNDIKAVLPVEKIKELYYTKLQTSKVFAEFVEKISSPEMQSIVDTLFRNETFMFMLNKGRSYGLDVERLADLLHRMFGLNFPRQY